MAKTRRGPRVVTDEHKAAMKAGRAESKVISAYLEALENNKPKRGRKRTRESIENRLATIEDDIQSASAIRKLELTQQRMDLTAELERIDSGAGVDLEELKGQFLQVAKDYSKRKGISYDAWRKSGVEAAVLREAGITRGG